MSNPDQSPIKGYTHSPALPRVHALNQSKAVQEILARVIERTKANPDVNADPRLMAVAATQFELGFLALGKAIMQPARLTDDDLDAELDGVMQAIGLMPVQLEGFLHEDGVVTPTAERA